LHAVRDRVERAREIAVGHRVSFGFAGPREATALLSASIRNAFMLTFPSLRCRTNAST
jgi:hypothetical protein